MEIFHLKRGLNISKVTGGRGKGVDCKERCSSCVLILTSKDEYTSIRGEGGSIVKNVVVVVY